jgi:hypothetical protein
MERLTLLFLVFIGLLVNVVGAEGVPYQEEGLQIKKQDGSWWVDLKSKRRGSVLLIRYEYKILKTGKTMSIPAELQDGHRIMIGKVNEITQPVIIGFEYKRYDTDPEHDK